MKLFGGKSLRGSVCFFLIVAVVITTVFSAESSTEALHTKPKMLIFSSPGGYGHQAASQELVRIFNKEYDIKVINLLAEGPLKSTDEVRRLSFGLTSGEELYNLCLRKEWIRGVQFMSSAVKDYIWSHRRLMRQAIHAYLEKERPDFIISVLPVFNMPALEVAAEMKIPYLLITLDPDLRMWVLGLEAVKHPNFRVTVGYDLPTTRGLLEKHGVARSSIATTGFPLREGFLKKHDVAATRKKWGVKKGVPVLLVMMGGAGGKTAYTYAKAFAKMNLKAHVIICTGRNSALRERIAKLQPIYKGMTLKPIGFTQEIPELMTMADVVVTKPGPGSIYEAIACKTPIICNNIGLQIPWEVANIDLIKNNQLGYVVNNMKELEPAVHKILDHHKVRDQIKRNMKKFHPFKFNHDVQKIVHQMRTKK